LLLEPQFITVRFETMNSEVLRFIEGCFAHSTGIFQFAHYVISCEFTKSF